jgi:hypothetical protein
MVRATDFPEVQASGAWPAARLGLRGRLDARPIVAVRTTTLPGSRREAAVNLVVLWRRCPDRYTLALRRSSG